MSELWIRISLEPSINGWINLINGIILKHGYWKLEIGSRSREEEGRVLKVQPDIVRLYILINHPEYSGVSKSNNSTVNLRELLENIQTILFYRMSFVHNISLIIAKSIKLTQIVSSQTTLNHRISFLIIFMNHVCWELNICLCSTNNRLDWDNEQEQRHSS